MFRCCMFRCIILFLVFFKVRWWNINFLNSSPLCHVMRKLWVMWHVALQSAVVIRMGIMIISFSYKKASIAVISYLRFSPFMIYFLSCDHFIFLPDARRGIWVKLSLDFREWKYSQFNTNYSKILMLLRVPRHKPIYIVSKANSSNKKSMERN